MKKMKLGVDSPDIVGIDLGTTNCAVAVYSANTVPTLLPVGEGDSYTVPSCVRWDEPYDTRHPSFTVGVEAYRERYFSDVVYSVKRIMGSGEKILLRSRSDETRVLELTPVQVSASILSYLKIKVKEFYKDCSDCIITVPAYFNQRQITDTLDAAKLAGWNCRQILKEPTSASYIYSQLGYASNGDVLIYDLGGGTFDVTHMRFLRRDSIPSKLLTSLKRQYGIDISQTTADFNEQFFCRVLGTYGDVKLGGDDIDAAMGDRTIESQKLKLSESGVQKLYLKCEEFKKLNVEGMDTTIEGHRISLKKDDLNWAVDTIFDRTMALMKGIDLSNVKTIVLVGGSTKSERLRKDLSDTFPGIEISAVLDPDATVALGAGSVAKAVANKKDLLYADVLPLPIGILINEKEIEVCISRNTSLPYSVKKVYHTLYNNQSTVDLHLYQGLSTNPKECTYLGRISMSGIPPKPAGEVDVEVSYVLTAQGTLKIMSHIEGVEKEESLIIDNIFSVDNSNSAETVADGGMDTFESCFMSLLEGNEEAARLFEQRRKMKENGEDVSEIEDKIVSLTL